MTLRQFADVRVSLHLGVALATFLRGCAGGMGGGEHGGVNAVAQAASAKVKRDKFDKRTSDAVTGVRLAARNGMILIVAQDAKQSPRAPCPPPARPSPCRARAHLARLVCTLAPRPDPTR